MKYYELTFHLRPCSEDATDVLAAMLAEVGFETFVPTASGLLAYLPQHSLPLQQDGTTDTSAIDAVFADFPFPDTQITFTLQVAPDEDWNATWEAEGFEPICIDNRLYIYDDRTTPSSLIPHPSTLILHPRQAFGTGSHQTTQMVLQQLLDLDLKGCTLIDAGCGTGILGIAAAMFGATNIFAYDIDTWSVRNTEENFALNALRSSYITILEGDASVLSQAPQADVLVANIHRNIILNDMATFVAHLHPEGHLIISGFLAEDVEPLTACAKALGLTLVAHTSNTEWQCLHFTLNL